MFCCAKFKPEMLEVPKVVEKLEVPKVALGTPVDTKDGVVPVRCDLGVFLTVKDDATVEEYLNVFWTHGNSKVVESRGETYELPASRGDFVDEKRTTLYQNTKNEKQLFLNCYDVNMPVMAEMMGGEQFAKLEEPLWEINPATGVNLRVSEAVTGSPTSDVVVFATIKDGISVDEYLEVFWSHADKAVLEWKGELYDVTSSRSEMCDESRTKVFKNTKNEQQIMISCFGCNMEVMGSVWGGDAFKKLNEQVCSIDAMEFLTSPPAPPQTKPCLGAPLHIKEDATVQEYTDLFWTHGDSTSITVRGQDFTLPASRSTFVDESKTTIYQNIKDEKDLFINCYDVDMETMGAMMGGEEFQKMAAMIWDMNPADMRLRTTAPKEGTEGQKQDIVCFAQILIPVEEWLPVFWSHADQSVVEYDGESYDVGASRSELCDESRTQVYQNSKDSSRVMLRFYDCDMEALGKCMGGENFVKMGEKTFKMESMEFLSTMPPPPEA